MGCAITSTAPAFLCPPSKGSFDKCPGGPAPIWGPEPSPPSPPGMCSTAALHAQEYFGAVAPWGRGTLGDGGALGCCCRLLSIPAGTDGSVLNPGLGRMRQTPAAPISSHWCTWGAGGERVVPLLRKWSWTPPGCLAMGARSPSTAWQGCGKHSHAARNPNGFTVGISAGQQEVWGEKSPFMSSNCARQAGLTRSCEQAEERKNATGFHLYVFSAIFMSGSELTFELEKH